MASIDPPVPDTEQLALLRRAADDGGYLHGPDADTAERCAASGWLIAEGDVDYALTIDGWVAVRRAQP